jgi:hypothetical protein
VGFETSEGCIATVERHLYRIESEVVGQHLQMNLGIFVSGESYEADLALLLGGEKSFGRAIRSKN